jgi:hypothetical protein
LIVPVNAFVADPAIGFTAVEGTDTEVGSTGGVAVGVGGAALPVTGPVVGAPVGTAMGAPEVVSRVAEFGELTAGAETGVALTSGGG